MISFEWPHYPGALSGSYLSQQIALGLLNLDFDFEQAQVPWPGMLAANLAMGALLCAAEERGRAWGDRWREPPMPMHSTWIPW